MLWVRWVEKRFLGFSDQMGFAEMQMMIEMMASQCVMSCRSHGY